MKPILIELPEKLKTPSCVLSCFRPGDGPRLNEAVVASLDHLRPTMPWAQEAPTQEFSEELVRKFHAQWLNRESDLGLAILDLDENRQLGGIGLVRNNWDLRIFEMGYWIRPDAEGKGVVTHAVTALTGVCFEFLEAIRVFIRCNADNLRSANVARRAGYIEEGRLLNAGVKPDGTVTDMLSFGMTPGIWSTRIKS